MRSVSFSLLLFLVGCGGVPRPDTNLYVINSGALEARGYNLKTDYDDDGNLNPNAVPKVLPFITMDDVNKFVCTDPKGLANLKAFVQTMREEYMKCQQGLKAAQPK